MSDDADSFFEACFVALTGHNRSFRWQGELFRRLCDDDIPRRLNLPTGLGKTSVMAAWLIALGWQARLGAENVRLPRRLVWVVDRRVVVDQATTEAELLANNLEEAHGADELRNALRSLSITGDPDAVLAVSTLRGERADNRAWSLDPSRPAIIVGTVDMTGSRLLFSGYGDSRRRRPLHAALLGQDALIVNDEAHLTPAFAGLLASVREFARGERPLRMMLLSATPRGNTQAAFPENLEADLANEVFQKRCRAVKRLHLCEHDDPKREMQRLAGEPNRRTIVFVRSPEDARRLAAAIESRHKGVSVPLLTGMQRGWERDRLLQDPVVQRFLAKETPPADAEPCWLVATSAGEVGIDLSADRLITDLDTADHLLQRFGRLNRFGETEGEVHVVYSPKQITGDKGNAPLLKATLDYLKTLSGVSPETLWMQPPPATALPEDPHFAPLLPWHIDVWSMTSIPAGEWPSRPAVEYWLRGEDEASAPPETYVAWREDIDDLANPSVSPRDHEEVFDCYPVLAQERLKQYTHYLRDALRKSGYLRTRAILIASDGEIRSGTLAELVEDRGLFRYATLLLPPGVGHLDRNGMVDWSKPTDRLSPEDLARYDKSATDTRTRVRLAPGEAEPETGLRRRYTVELAPDDENEEGPRWVYFVGKREKAAKFLPELLADHQERVASVAAELACRLGFDERMVRVFDWTGQWHDAGKDRGIWQGAAGNQDGPPLAKSERLSGRRLAGYRHELGSLLDAESQLPEDFTPWERDLALHLVAAHHGWARPHFPDRAFDKDAYRRSERAAIASARRFGRLQQRLGAWVLAYLEAVFRSADAIASVNAPEMPANA